jgi:hypothetical protein
LKPEGEMPARAAIGSGSQSQNQQGTVTAIVAVGWLRKSTRKSISAPSHPVRFKYSNVLKPWVISSRA